MDIINTYKIISIAKKSTTLKQVLHVRYAKILKEYIYSSAPNKGLLARKYKVPTNH